VTEPVVLSWSGGKDSTLALAALRRDERFEVVALLTSVTREYDRISIHGVRRALLEAQARALGLPLIELALDPASSNEAYEAAFRAAVDEVRSAFPGVRTIAFGDLFLEDVRVYRERLVATTGMEALFPLWARPTAALAEELVRLGYRAHLVCVDTRQLAARFAGRAFDAALLAELPPGVDPCGERGEFHTFVSGGPVFSRPVPVTPGEVVLREERFAYCDLLPADSGGAISAMRLVWPSERYLPSYVAALERGWSPDNSRPEGGREQLAQIAADPAEFLQSLVDREAKGPPVTLPDGSTVPRLPGYRKWMWDGEFCGSIGLRWQPGTSALPPNVLGHVGYAVVPWKRGLGYATLALKLILPDARAEGLESIELTTDADNVPSQRVITANGGVLVEPFLKLEQHGRGEALRFRIDLAAS
jgi:uncharacterized protein (TIGR00290 family)